MHLRQFIKRSAGAGHTLMESSAMGLSAKPTTPHAGFHAPYTTRVPHALPPSTPGNPHTPKQGPRHYNKHPPPSHHQHTPHDFKRFFKHTMVEDPWAGITSRGQQPVPSNPRIAARQGGTQQLHQSLLHEAIRQQVEFYFSPQNLSRDEYLRSLMEPQGWVQLSVVASFKRLASLTQETGEVVQALARSRTVEVSADRQKIRARSRGKEAG